MNKIVQRLLLLFIVFLFMTSSSLHLGDKKKLQIKTGVNKIIFEYSDAGAVATSDDYNVVKSFCSENEEYLLQIELNYQKFDEKMYHDICVDNQSYVESSKNYHTSKNRELINSLNMEECELYVSSYTPYVFVRYQPDSSIEKMYELAVATAEKNCVDNVRIFPSSIYELDLKKLNSNGEGIKDKDILPDAGDDFRVTHYENFPNGTHYSGKGIKIGILDTGIFDTNHSNFSGTRSKVVYDKYVANDTQANAMHPTWVASVLGGEMWICTICKPILC